MPTSLDKKRVVFDEIDDSAQLVAKFTVGYRVERGGMLYDRVVRVYATYGVYGEDPEPSFWVDIDNANGFGSCHKFTVAEEAMNHALQAAGWQGLGVG